MSARPSRRGAKLLHDQLEEPKPPHCPERPLAAASRRLHRPAGRPRKAPVPEPDRGFGNHGPAPAPAREAAIATSCSRLVAEPTADASPVLPLRPRLVDLAGAAAYMVVKPWHVRDLIRSGALARVSVPLGPDRRGRRADGRLRRVLVDVDDLDQLVAAWKVDARAGR
jgi:hypothetical protein